MPRRFKGTLADLKAFIEKNGFEGDWSEEGKGKYVFRSSGGAVLNWWGPTGTLQFQGAATDRARIESLFSDSGIASAHRAEVAEVVRRPSRIFIVHGHDNEARDQLELALRRLGLEPFILMNTAGGGKTIIEALEGQIGRDFSSDFGIVLMTPDDMGYSRADGSDRAEPRARQNVVLETGMLLSSLTRSRMAIVVKGHIELPSDLQGIIRFGYNDHVKEVVPKLCQRLREAGFDLDSDHIAAAAQ